MKIQTGLRLSSAASALNLEHVQIPQLRERLVSRKLAELRCVMGCTGAVCGNTKRRARTAVIATHQKQKEGLDNEAAGPALAGSFAQASLSLSANSVLLRVQVALRLIMGLAICFEYKLMAGPADLHAVQSPEETYPAVGRDVILVQDMTDQF